MRKVCAAILSAAICLAVSGAPAWASEQQATLSAGYLHALTNTTGSDDLNGINVKYRYEFTDTLGLITSFSYANAEGEQKTHYNDTRWHEDSVRNRWFSVMAGPSVRVNEWFSAYALAGVSYARVSSFAGDYVTLTSDEGKKQEHLTRSDSGRRSHTALTYSAGVQINPTENIVVDLAYEASGRGDWRT
ncbi:Ail/Lom family outer membrane beta-barrel protein, partial [Escherichia coli]